MSAQPVSAWHTYRRLIRLAKPYRALLLLALLGVIEAAASGAAAI